MDRQSPPYRSAALGLWTALALSTVLVASRRYSGAYAGPLPTAALVVAVLLAVTMSLASLWLFRRDQSRTHSTVIAWLPELTAWAIPTVFALVIAAAAAPAQLGSVFGIAAIGAVVLGVTVLETTDWWANAMSKPQPVAATAAVEIAPIKVDSPIEINVVGETPHPAAVFLSDEEAEPADEEPDDGITTQWMTRRDEPDGEAIEGTVRVHFTPGQRESVVHVTFCPPLSSVPDVELECIDGDEWQLKTEAALPYGLRIQIRRSAGVTLDQSGRIAYLATAIGHSKAA